MNVVLQARITVWNWTALRGRGQTGMQVQEPAIGEGSNMKRNRMNAGSILICLLTASMVTVTPSWGQQITAAINGTVTDPSGSPVANAKVTAKDNDRGTVQATESNAAGSFDLPTLPIGNYTIKVERDGFQAQQSTVTLVLNQT